MVRKAHQGLKMAVEMASSLYTRKICSLCALDNRDMFAKAGRHSETLRHILGEFFPGHGEHIGVVCRNCWRKLLSFYEFKRDIEHNLNLKKRQQTPPSAVAAKKIKLEIHAFKSPQTFTTITTTLDTTSKAASTAITATVTTSLITATTTTTATLTTRPASVSTTTTSTLTTRPATATATTSALTTRPATATATTSTLTTRPASVSTTSTKTTATQSPERAEVVMPEKPWYTLWQSTATTTTNSMAKPQMTDVANGLTDHCYAEMNTCGTKDWPSWMKKSVLLPCNEEELKRLIEVVRRTVALLSTNKTSVLFNIGPANMTGESLFSEAYEELKRNVPFLYELLNELVGNSGNKPATIALIYAMIINSRNKKASAIQRLLTILAVKCHADGELLTKLNKLHITQSEGTKINIMKELKRHQEMMQKLEAEVKVEKPDEDDAENVDPTNDLPADMVAAECQLFATKCSPFHQSDSDISESVTEGGT